MPATSIKNLPFEDDFSIKRSSIYSNEECLGKGPFNSPQLLIGRVLFNEGRVLESIKLMEDLVEWVQWKSEGQMIQKKAFVGGRGQLLD